MMHGPSSVRSTRAQMDIKGINGLCDRWNEAALRQCM